MPAEEEIQPTEELTPQDEVVEDPSDEYGDPEGLEEEEARPAATDDTDSSDGGADDKDTSTKEEADEPEGVEFDDEIISIAKSLGVDEETARSFASVDKLEDYLQKKANEVKEELESEKSAKKEDESDELDLNPEEWDADTIKVLKEMRSKFKAESEALKKELAQLKEVTAKTQKAYQTQAIAAFAERFEGWVQELGDTYKDELGEGPGLDLDPKSDAYENRNAVYRQMLVDAENWTRVHPNKEMPRDREMFRRAVKALFGDKEQTRVTDTLKDKAIRRSKQITSRPSSAPKNTVEAAEARAIARIEEYQRSVGAVAEAEEDDVGY